MSMWDAYRTDRKGKVRPITKCRLCGRVSVFEVCTTCIPVAAPHSEPGQPSLFVLEDRAEPE